MNIGFDMKSDLASAYWQFSYTVDSIKKRYTVMLGSTEVADIKAGAQTIDFSCKSIDTSGIKPSRLANAGVLRAELRRAKVPGTQDADDEIIAEVNSVV